MEKEFKITIVIEANEDRVIPSLVFKLENYVFGGFNEEDVIRKAKRWMEEIKATQK